MITPRAVVGRQPPPATQTGSHRLARLCRYHPSTENITVGEGTDIRFVPRADVLDRQLVPSARVLLTRFLGGDQGATIG